MPLNEQDREGHDLWGIRVTGVVQGVGFRPFVYKIAHEHGLRGWVCNDPAGVMIEAIGADHALESFVADISERAPELARVEGVKVIRGLMPSGQFEPEGFTIVESSRSGSKTTVVPPDSHVCNECVAELRDPRDRRHRYPFINCTNCGPRYSIVRALPYDREQTTMAAFTMCDPCSGEYSDPLDRRYHAQPNACEDCGPRLLLRDAFGVELERDEALRRCARELANGGIAGIKGVGGFHLAVDATDASAVGLLRKRKRRDSKPFAVMVRDLETARRLVRLSEEEERVLTSPARPIVLARKREGSLPEEVAPRNPNLGVMLPSAPYHYLLLDEPGLDVLVMTSGNISGYPIAYRNEEALRDLFEVADVILHHDREIELRVDDSVVRLSEHPDLGGPLKVFIRRARGYAPYPVEVVDDLEPVVAYGAELKTTVALAAGSKVFISQHIGDLKNDETFTSHRNAARHLASLYDLDPRVEAYDLHPQFRSTRSAQSREHTSDVVHVQHHHAHMASCMAENHVQGTALGVVFDGAGYGTDGTVWGGEFLLGDYTAVERIAHLRPLPLLGGEKAVREPVRTGFAVALDAFGGDPEHAVRAFPALEAFTPDERRVYATMAERRINSPMVSSMGRLFDGVAALLGVLWGVTERLPGWVRRGVLLPVAAGVAGGAVVLAVMA